MDKLHILHKVDPGSILHICHKWSLNTKPEVSLEHCWCGPTKIIIHILACLSVPLLSPMWLDARTLSLPLCFHKTHTSGLLKQELVIVLASSYSTHIFTCFTLVLRMCFLLFLMIFFLSFLLLGEGVTHKSVRAIPSSMFGDNLGELCWAKDQTWVSLCPLD